MCHFKNTCILWLNRFNIFTDMKWAIGLVVQTAPPNVVRDFLNFAIIHFHRLSELVRDHLNYISPWWEQLYFATTPPRLSSKIINRPGVAGAALQTPLSFIHWFIHSLMNCAFSSESSKRLQSQTIRARELKFGENGHPWSDWRYWRLLPYSMSMLLF